MMDYIALEQYSGLDMEKIASLPSIDGVVLGDLYCSKRMLQYEESELTETVKLANENGIEVIFQTPRYLTERNFDKVMQLISYFLNRCLLSKVILQDAGAVNYLHKRYPDLQIIWGHMGLSRNGADNLLHYSFLQELGVTDIETDRVSRIPCLMDLGLNVMLMNEHITYNSVNRECYYEHELGIYDGNCGRRCRREELILKNEAYGFEFAVNGYTLGKQYTPLTGGEKQVADPANRIYRAADLQELMSRFVICAAEGTKNEIG